MSFKEMVRSAMADGGAIDKILVVGLLVTSFSAASISDWTNAIACLALVGCLLRIGKLADKLRAVGVKP